MASKLLTAVPTEVQQNILEMLDRDSLSRLSRTNKQWSARANRLLWENIDFVAIKEDEFIDRDDLIVIQCAFFTVCDRIMDANPQRWEELASLVRTLRLVRVHGIAIPKEIPEEENSDWYWHTFAEPEARSIFDVIACFKNLETFHFYMKDPMDASRLAAKYIRKLKGALTKLRTLELGGEIGEDLVVRILSQPENIETLTCAGLQNGDVGQRDFSSGVVFLSDIAHRFTRLRKLHLTRLALRTEAAYNPDDSDGRDIWCWDPEPDRDVLQDWATLLTHVAPTIVEMTLGAHYVNKGHGSNEVSEVPINFKPEDFTGPPPALSLNGIASSRRFREIILPALAKQPWPRLDWLIFTGVHLNREVLVEEGVWDQLIAGPQVDVMAGEVVDFQYDATPLMISPPGGSFQVHDDMCQRMITTISDRKDYSFYETYDEDDGGEDDDSEVSGSRDDEEIEEDYEV